MRYIKIGIVFALLPLVGCQEVLIDDPTSQDPMENFESLWMDVDERYSYLELKDIPWDSLRIVYRSRIREDMDQYELFSLLSDLLAELKDGHVNLQSDFDRSRYWGWYLDFPENFDPEVIERHYLANDYQIAGPLLYKTIDSVLYIRCSSFAQEMSKENLSEVFRLLKDQKGCIVDVRNNGGGSSGNAEMLAGMFINDRIFVGQKRVKTGPGPDDFSEWRDWTVSQSLEESYEGAVIVLTNRRSYSATNHYAQIMKEVPHAQLLGDQSGGGGGTPVYGELPIGWRYRFSATQTIDPDGNHIENGVEVDIRLDLDESDLEEGKDSMIERALEILTP